VLGEPQSWAGRAIHINSIGVSHRLEIETHARDKLAPSLHPLLAPLRRHPRQRRGRRLISRAARHSAALGRAQVGHRRTHRGQVGRVPRLILSQVLGLRCSLLPLSRAVLRTILRTILCAVLRTRKDSVTNTVAITRPSQLAAVCHGLRRHLSWRDGLHGHCPLCRSAHDAASAAAWSEGCAPGRPMRGGARCPGWGHCHPPWCWGRYLLAARPVATQFTYRQDVASWTQWPPLTDDEPEAYGCDCNIGGTDNIVDEHVKPLLRGMVQPSCFASPPRSSTL